MGRRLRDHNIGYSRLIKTTDPPEGTSRTQQSGDAYTEDSVWRNRDQFVIGRAEIVEFVPQKWQRELDYALRKELWAFTDNRIAVRFQYESRDRNGQSWRSYGTEHGILLPVR